MKRFFTTPEKKRAFVYRIIAISGAVMIATAIFAARGFSNPIIAEPGDSHAFTLNSTQFASSSLGTEFNTADPKKFSDADYVQQTFDAPDSPVMNYFLAKKDSSNNLVLAPGGQVFNYSLWASYKGRITGISSVVVNYSGGALYAQDGDAGSYSIYGKKVAITSGTPVSFESLPNFVMISNSRANTTITSITYNYSCSEAGYIVGRLGNRYNGAASDGTAYTLERNGSSVTMNGQSGTISVNANGTFTMSFASGASTYNGTISEDYKTLSITSTAGSALNISELNRIYVMDDFEGYSQTGTGLKSGKTVASDLRFSYYGDYGGGGYSTWITSSSFDVAQSADYVNLTTAVKHGGSKSATFKGWTGGWTRAWSRETFDMKHHYNFGSGNKLSFWAHGPYTNTACTTDSTNNGKIRVQVYYQKFEINDSNRNSTTYGSGTKDFTINAGSDWTEYSFSIDPSKSVYAINIMVDNSSISSYKNIYIPIDDIEISTNPVFEPTKQYNETATRFTKSYNGSVVMKIMGTSYTFTVKVSLGANGYIYAYAGADMEPTGYTVSGNQIAITTSGSYSGKSFGNWVGTLSNSNSTITILKSNISGTITDYMSSSSITLNENTKLIDGSEGNLATIETKVKRQYNPGSRWTDDPGNADRLSVNSEYYMQGSNSIRVRPYSSGGYRVIVQPSLMSSIGALDSVGCWFYAPAGTTYQISIYSYKTTDATGDYKQCIYKKCSDTDPEANLPSGWHYLDAGLYKSDGYGRSFAIWFGANSNQTILDYVTYF